MSKNDEVKSTSERGETKLTDKQKRFIEEYLVDLNATQAAIRAGYSAKTADVQGAQNLVKLKGFIQEEQKKTICARSNNTRRGNPPFIRKC